MYERVFLGSPFRGDGQECSGRSGVDGVVVVRG